MNKFIRNILALFLAIYAITSFQTVMANWDIQHEKTSDREVLDRNLSLHEHVVEQLANGKRLMINDQVYNYYLKNQAILYLTPPTRQIAYTYNMQNVAQRLEELSIGSMILYQDNFFDYYDRTVLYEYLDDPDHAFISAQNQDFRVYVIDPALVSAHNNQINPATEKFQEALTTYQNNDLDRSTILYQEAIKLYPDITKVLSRDDHLQTKEFIQFITDHYLTFKYESSDQLFMEQPIPRIPLQSVDPSQGLSLIHI